MTIKKSILEVEDVCDGLLLEGRIEEGNEKEPLPDGIIARVHFEGAQQADNRNRNGNIYPFTTLESAVQELNTRISQGTVLMNASHPARVRDSTGKVVGIEEAPISGPQGVAAKITGASIDKDTGRVDITTDLFETTAGKDIKAIVKGGGKVPVSSRSKGQRKLGVHEGRFGKIEGNVLQPGMVMETFDFVTKNSVETALHSSAQLESANETQEEQTMDLTELKSKHPELVNALQQEFATGIGSKLTTAVTESEDRIRAEVQSNFEERLAEKDQQITNLAGQIDVLKSIHESEEGLSGGDETVVESDDPRVTVLETQISELTTQLEQKGADELLVAKCHKHPMGDLIFENCAGKADTAAEAEGLFDFTSGLIDQVSSRLARSSAKGLPNGSEVLESDDGGDGSQSARSTMRRLAGVE